MVCTPEAASLTLAGNLVHLHAANRLVPFNQLSVDVPDALIQVTEKESLPKNQAALADMGDQWIRSGEAVVLRIPDALSPLEYNLSTAHSEHESCPGRHHRGFPL